MEEETNIILYALPFTSGEGEAADWLIAMTALRPHACKSGSHFMNSTPKPTIHLHADSVEFLFVNRIIFQAL